MDDQVEILDKYPDVNGDSIMVGDTVRHRSAGMNGIVTNITRDRGRVVIWVNNQSEWMPHDVRRIS